MKLGVSDSASDAGSTTTATDEETTRQVAVLSQALKNMQLELKKRDEQILSMSKRLQEVGVAKEAPVHDDESSREDSVNMEAARSKLGRLCRKKANGRLKVPESVHEEWLKAGEARNRLMATFLKHNQDKVWGNFRAFMLIV